MRTLLRLAALAGLLAGCGGKIADADGSAGGSSLLAVPGTLRGFLLFDDDDARGEDLVGALVRGDGTWSGLLGDGRVARGIVIGNRLEGSGDAPSFEVAHSYESGGALRGAHGVERYFSRIVRYTCESTTLAVEGPTLTLVSTDGDRSPLEPDERVTLDYDDAVVDGEGNVTARLATGERRHVELTLRLRSLRDRGIDAWVTVAGSTGATQGVTGWSRGQLLECRRR